WAPKERARLRSRAPPLWVTGIWAEPVRSCLRRSRVPGSCLAWSGLLEDQDNHFPPRIPTCTEGTELPLARGWHQINGGGARQHLPQELAGPIGVLELKDPVHPHATARICPQPRTGFHGSRPRLRRRRT